MANVTLTASMRNNLLALQNTQKLFDSTQERLSTGKKVNSALDNPSSYFTSQSLSSRADALTTLLDSMGQGVQTLKAADQGLTTLNNLAEQAKTLVNSALDTKDTATYKIGSVDVKAGTDLGTIGGITSDNTFTVRIGESDKLISTQSVTKDQKLATLPGVDVTKTVDIRLQDTKGNVTEKKIAITADTTVDQFLESVRSSFGYDDQGNDRVNVAVVDGKMSITSADKNMSLIALGDNAKAMGFDIGTEVDLQGSLTAAEKAASMQFVTNTAGITGASTLADGAFTIKVGDAAAVDIEIGAGKDLETGATVNDLITYINDNVDGASARLSAAKEASDSSVAGLLIQSDDPANALVIGGAAATVFGTGYAAAAPADTGTAYPTDSATTYELMQKLNAIEGLEATITDQGRLKLSVTNGEDLVITDTAGAASGALGLAGVSTNGSTVRADYAKQFDDILTQINQLVQNDDTGYKGINLLNGDNLTVNFNESRTSNILIEGQKMDAKSMGLKVSVNEWRTADDINEALSQIEGAIGEISSVSSTFAQNLSIVQTRQDFTENMVNILETGSDQLVLADMNEEAANMLALQVRQQLATNALSLSSQSAQSVLSLF